MFITTIIERLKSYDFKWKFKATVALPIFILFVASDWITKGIVASNFSQGDSFNIIPLILNGNFIINLGSAFGMNSGNKGLTIFLASFVTLLFTILFIFVNDKKWIIVVTFIVSGSFGNLFGRIWAPAIIVGNQIGEKFGVIDFLKWDFSFFGSNSYIFNIADLWVNVGIGLAILCLIIEIIKATIVWNMKRKFELEDGELSGLKLTELIKKNKEMRSHDAK